MNKPVPIFGVVDVASTSETTDIEGFVYAMDEAK